MNWCDRDGKDTDVILMTRVIIARNIKGFPFPVKMKEEEKENVIGMVRQAAGDIGMNFVRVDELDDGAKKDLYEKYLIEENIINKDSRTGILVNKDEDTSVVINQEEHIVINSAIPGSAIESAYMKAQNIAAAFEKKMEIAYSDRFGFLLSNISDVGTGLRIFSLASLPGIEKTAGAIAVLNKRLEKYDWQIAPVSYSGGLKASGFYRLYNTSTLGVTEKDVLDNARKAFSDVIKLERTCRSNIYKKKGGIVEDQYYRAYAVLKYARRLDVEELYAMLNWIRLVHEEIKNPDGVDLDWDKIHRLTNSVTRNYSEVKVVGKRTPVIAKNRAERIRKILNGGEA